MYTELLHRPEGHKFKIWKDFLTRAGLEAGEDTDQTVLIWDDSRLIATGSRKANLLKYIAVDDNRRGEDLTASILTQLRCEAFREGHRHLFLYTKPENKYLFSSLFFYPVAQTDKVLLMEDRKNGIQDFIDNLPTIHTQGTVGAAVMNCNPFTMGHRYLIETAAGECDHVYIFVLSEDKSRFSAADRMEMVRLGTADLSNVTVLPTGPYLISSATFPTYFLKDRENAEEIHCQLDIEIFTKYFVPKFSITHRYVGTEPFSPITSRYNDALKAYLPQNKVMLREIPRCSTHIVDTTGANTGHTISDEAVSAGAVRTMMDTGNTEVIRTLVPQTTFDYLKAKDLIP